MIKKELSIEEKAMAYEKALEFVKGWYNDSSTTKKEKLMLELAFHELKENEDERIRKKICKLLWDNAPYEEAQEYISWLEKQGDQKPIDPDTIIQQRLDALDDIVTEQKPAAKVEQKFKVGDWVVYDHRAYQVVELPKEGYINLGLRRNGKIEFAPSPYCRHWTIQDAKDGDVLVSKYEQPFIYNGIFDNLSVGGFCGIDSGGFAFTIAQDNHKTWTNNIDIHPATKEQCDLLFQKMHEAGYEWDAEKKEINKIEPKFNGEDYGIDGLYHAQRILEKTLGSVDGYQSDDGILEHKCAISAVKKLSEHKGLKKLV